jgi:hypothetical protein
MANRDAIGSTRQIAARLLDCARDLGNWASRCVTQECRQQQRDTSLTLVEQTNCDYGHSESDRYHTHIYSINPQMQDAFRNLWTMYCMG